MTKDEVLKLALEALEDYKYAEARTIIREALAQPEQEPVAWMTPTGALYRTEDVDGCFDETHIPLYTTPPQPEPVIDKSAAVRIATALGWEPKRTWQGLTDEEIGKILERGDIAERDAEHGWWHVLPYSFSRAIEAKLKEKNT